MYKKIFLILVFFLIFVTSIKASAEIDYLLAHKTDSVQDTAYTSLALKTDNSYSSQLNTSLTTLKSNLNSCMQDNNCNIENFALSLLALKNTNRNLEQELAWLLNARTIKFSSSLEGTWLIQIISPVSGSCKLKNTETQNEQTITVNADYTPWQQISSTLLQTTTRSLELDCSSISATNLVLSLIHKKQESGIYNYYIKQEEHNQNKIILEFGNPCWGSTYRATTCNNDITALVLYTLTEFSKPADPTWLEQQTLTPLQKAFLYKVTNKETYLTELQQTKNIQGYWGSPSQVYETAMIYYLLKNSLNLETTSLWLELQKAPENCWPKPKTYCNIKTTSAVILSQATQLTPTQIPTPTCYENDGCSALCIPPDKDCNPTCVSGDGCKLDCSTRDADCVNCIKTNDCDNDTFTDLIDSAPFDPNLPKPTPGNGGDGYKPGDPCTTIEGCDGKYNWYGGCEDIEEDNCPEEVPPPDGAGQCLIENNSCTTYEGCIGTCNSLLECEDIPNDNCPRITTRTTDREREDEEENGHSVLFWLLMVILLLIILIGGGYLAYKKGLLKFKFGEKPKPTATYKPPLITERAKPTSYRPAIRHRAREKSPFRKTMESALEKSMQELEELIKEEKK